MPSRLLLATILLAAASVTAADRMPQAGSYGFNWLDPQSRCRKMTAEDLSRFSGCTITANAFGLELESYTCKVDARTELVVYATATQCQEALETMQANAP